MVGVNDWFCLIYQCMCTLHVCRFPFNWPRSSSSHLKTKIKKEEFCPKFQPCFNYVSIWCLPWALPERNAVKTYCWILLRKVCLEYLQHFQMHALSISRGSKCRTLKILKLGCVWFLSYLPNIWRYKCRFGLALFSNCLHICYFFYHSKWFSCVQKCHLYCENSWLWRFFFRKRLDTSIQYYIHPTYIGALVGILRMLQDLLRTSRPLVQTTGGQLHVTEWPAPRKDVSPFWQVFT